MSELQGLGRVLLFTGLVIVIADGLLLLLGKLAISALPGDIHR